MISKENKLLIEKYRTEVAELPDDAKVAFHHTMRQVAQALYEHFFYDDKFLKDYGESLSVVLCRIEHDERRALPRQLQLLDKCYFRFVENICDHTPNVHVEVDDRNSKLAMKLFGSLIFLSGTQIAIDKLYEWIKDDVLVSQYLVQNVYSQDDELRLAILKCCGASVADYFRNVCNVTDEKKLEEVEFFVRNLCYDEDSPYIFNFENIDMPKDAESRFRIVNERLEEIARKYGNTEFVQSFREHLERIKKKMFANGTSQNGSANSDDKNNRDNSNDDNDTPKK